MTAEGERVNEKDVERKVRSEWRVRENTWKRLAR